MMSESRLPAVVHDLFGITVCREAIQESLTTRGTTPQTAAQQPAVHAANQTFADRMHLEDH